MQIDIHTIMQWMDWGVINEMLSFKIFPEYATDNEISTVMLNQRFLLTNGINGFQCACLGILGRVSSGWLDALPGSMDTNRDRYVSTMIMSFSLVQTFKS